MLDGYVGREITQKALNMYINENKYGNAEAQDLWAAFDKVRKLLLSHFKIFILPV